MDQVEETSTEDAPVETGEVSDEQWAPSVRLRRGTRRRLEEMVDILSEPISSAAANMPEEVAQTFREAFRLSRRSFTPDVVVDTALAALKYLLTTPARQDKPTASQKSGGKKRRR